MPRFLGGITIIDKNGQPIKIEDRILQGKAFSVIDGSNTSGTYVLRDENGRFQVADPVADNDAANKKYVDDAVGPISSSLNEIESEIEQSKTDWVLKNENSVQIIESDTRYSRGMSDSTELVTKGYVDEYGMMPFTVSHSSSFDFPYDENCVSSLLIDWGDGNYNIAHFSPHHYNSGAFNGCFYFTTEIKDYAFYNCVRLTNITIPHSITSINERAFTGCGGLTSIIIPNSVVNIGIYAFDRCYGLTDVTMGNGMTSIGQSAFRGCVRLSSVTIYNETPPALGLNVFTGTSPHLVIYVPANAVETYKAATRWKDLKDNIQAIQGGE